MRHIVLAIGLFFFSSQFYAQGCSDAGFCSIGAMQHKDTIKHQLIIGSTYEGGFYDLADQEKTLAIISPYIQYNTNINRYLSLSAKVNFRYADDGSRCVSGFGDGFLNINYRLELEDDNQEIHFTLGGKAPLSKPDETRNFFLRQNMATPMAFQTTLGTYDLILGSTYKYKKISASLAYQQPLTSTEDWYYQDYKRQGDILIKPSYHFKPLKNLSIMPSVMAIYRLGEDEITSLLNSDGTYNVSATENLQKYKIAGTDGLTINLMADFKYTFAEDYHIGLMAAVPVLNRKTIIDGLKRQYVFALSLGFDL